MSYLFRMQKLRTVDDSGEELKPRLDRAILENTLIIVLLGEGEIRVGSLAVRIHARTEKQSLSLEKLCGRLKVEIGSGNAKFTH